MTEAELSNESPKATKTERGWRKVFRLLAAFHGFMVSLAFWVTLVVRMLAGGPQVEVTYALYPLFPPERTEAMIASRGTGADDQIKGLLHSPQLLELRVTNHMASRLTDLAVRINGTLAVADAAVAATFSRMDTTGVGRWELSGEQLTFPALKEIPPKTSVTVLVWGRFNYIFLGKPVEVTGSADSIKVSPTQEVSGLAIAVSNNLPFLAVVATIYFLLQGLFWYRKTEG